MAESIKIPAFGFDTKYRSAKIYEMETDENIESGKCSPEQKDAVMKCARYLQNANKILAYIPGIGNIIGITRLLSFSCKKNRKAKSIHFIERGAIEATGLGVVLLPVDIAVTLVRNHKAKKAQQQEQQPAQDQ